MKISKLNRRGISCNVCANKIPKGDYKFNAHNGVTCMMCRCNGEYLLYWSFARVKTINGGLNNK